MSIKTLACHTIHCDHCGQPLGDDYIKHFDDEQTAMWEAEEADWTVTDNGRAFCTTTACQLAVPECECEQRGCDSLACTGKCGCDRCETDPPVAKPLVVAK